MEYFCSKINPIRSRMKRTLLLPILLLASAAPLWAQHETPANDEHPHGVKHFGAFLLDTRLLMEQPATIPLSLYKIEIPDASKNYEAAFRLDPSATYSSGLSNLFAPDGRWSFTTGTPWGWSGLGLWGNATDNLQMGSFRLRNGWRLNTYGEYNREGRHVPNPSALPWQRDNYKGAFELKSENGFGIRIEVQKGKETPF